MRRPHRPYPRVRSARLHLVTANVTKMVQVQNYAYEHVKKFGPQQHLLTQRVEGFDTPDGRRELGKGGHGCRQVVPHATFRQVNRSRCPSDCSQFTAISLEL